MSKKTIDSNEKKHTSDKSKNCLFFSIFKIFSGTFATLPHCLKKTAFRVHNLLMTGSTFLPNRNKFYTYFLFELFI